MTQKFKGFGLVKSCNYRSDSKWVITKEGATIGNAPTLQEAKSLVNDIVKRGFIWYVVYMYIGNQENKLNRFIKKEDADRYMKELKEAYCNKHRFEIKEEN